MSFFCIGANKPGLISRGLIKLKETFVYPFLSHYLAFFWFNTASSATPPFHLPPYWRMVVLSPGFFETYMRQVTIAVNMVADPDPYSFE